MDTRQTEPAGRGGSELARVYDAVLNAITDGELLPGCKLTESDLCRRIRCSRNTVRGALSLLAHDKIVDLLPNRGAFVHVPDRREIREVFETRMALEEISLSMLAGAPDLAQRLGRLEDVAAERGRAQAEGDRAGCDRLSNAFHIELVRLNGNQVLADITASLCARSALMEALAGSRAKARHEGRKYEEILALLQQGRCRRAAKKIRKHLGAALARLEAQFEEAG